MTDKTVGEMPPTWFTVQIEEASQSADPVLIARTAGDIIAISREVREAIRSALESDNPAVTGRPGRGHLVRDAIIDALER